jgi:hypothetical protein
MTINVTKFSGGSAMFERISNSWQLVKASWAVLRADKELMFFPIISAITMIIILLVFFIPFAALTGIMSGAVGRSGNDSGGIVGVVIAFVFYVIVYSVNIFFNVALVGAAMIRLDGGDPTFNDGLKIARDRFPVILQYAIISATVGMVLQYLRERAGFLGSILGWLGGLAWNVTTFLVVPILAVKNVGPVDAIKESAALLKKTWGEQIAASFGLSWAFSLIFFAVIMIGMVLVGILASISSALGVLGGVILFAVILGLMVISSALGGVYQAALYRYAETGTAPTDFDINMIRGAFVDKNKR